jgi:dihydrofolate synthase / folylpolyglutamate synthase
VAVTDAILTRLLSLHPKIIDLGLERMVALMAKLGNPHQHLPPVIHVAGTNGKGSTIANLRAMLEAAGLVVHVYTSPHLVKFHERIRIAGMLISDTALSALLEECEVVNAGVPITFFEITTAAAFLAFSRTPADYVILETGLGGRLDATNIIDHPVATVITMIDYDHQQFLGDTLSLIAGEKAGIMKRGAPCIIGTQPDEAGIALERAAAKKHAPTAIANQDWQCFEQHGRLVFQDEQGLLDLPMPGLRGQHQIENAGNAIATLRALNDPRISEAAIAQGLKSVTWPARMQRLNSGKIHRLLGGACEVWLDGGHNPSAGKVLARAFSELNEKHSMPLVLVWGMLNTKDARAFIAPFADLAHHVIAIAIPDEVNAIPATDLAAAARAAGLAAETAADLETALSLAAQGMPGARILVCGSLYLAGHVLALDSGEAMSAVSGVARR